MEKLEKEALFLDGPQSRSYELGFMFKVVWDFFKGFRKLHFVGPCVTVFGSARFKEGDKYYEETRKVGAAIARFGFTTLTGGGPGVMEAANRGAFEAGGRSIGCNIVLPFEQHANPYVQTSFSVRHFFVRKVLLLKYSFAFFVMPGGFGTMDEFFETLTLIQTKTIKDFPIVIIGTEYFHPMRVMIQHMIANKTISEADLNLVLFTDDIEEGMNHIKKYLHSNYVIKKQRPKFWLFEK